MQLFEFQQHAVANIKARLLSASAVLLQSATGSGKTVIIGDFIKDYLADSEDHKVLCLVNLQVLVGQFHETLQNFGVQSSVLHDEITKDRNGVPFICDYSRRTLLTMPETFINTVAKLNKLEFDPEWAPTLIVIDEAHKGTSSNYQLIREMFPLAQILGMTATPFRDKNKHGEHLVEWYADNLVTTISVRNLIDLGRLVQPLYFSKNADDHVVENWKQFTEGHDNKSTIVFTRDTKHSFAMKDAFEAAGITVQVVTAGTDADPDFYVTPQTPLQRQAIYNDFETGKTSVLISVSALCEGFDSPRAKFCFMVRGVGNPALYQQMVGRVIRAYEGKEAGYIVDFCGNIEEHGHIEDYVWRIDADLPDTMMLKEGRTEISQESYVRKSSIYYRCEGCNHVYDIKRHGRCSHCNTKHTVKVTAKVSELILARVTGVADKKEYEHFKSRIKAANSNEQARMLVNKRHGEIFTPAGELAPGFEFLAQISTRGWTDIVALAA